MIVVPEGADDRPTIDESGIFDASSAPLRADSSSSNSMADTGTQTPEPDEDTVKEKRHLGASDYESCEELDDLREECRDLVTRKNSLEVEIEGYKGEIKNLRCRLEEGTGDQVLGDTQCSILSL